VQTIGPLAVPTGQAGYLLDEGSAGAVHISAGEAADAQLEHDSSSRTGHISGKPQVTAMNPV